MYWPRKLCDPWVMRPGQLRSLLQVLRANGVTEFSGVDGKGTVSIKLADARAPLPVLKGKAAKLEPPLSEAGRVMQQLQTPEAADMLKKLGVPAETMADVLVGLS